MIAAISSISQGQFTALYEAMDSAINQLQRRDAEGKAVVTFTDGTDNLAPPGLDPNFLTNKLISDPNLVKVSSFTIGFSGTGGVDQQILASLAVNGGLSSFPSDFSELGTVFEEFSSAISNVYSMRFRTSNQIISPLNPQRIRFKIQVEEK